MTKHVDQWQRVKTYVYNRTLEKYLFECQQDGLEPCVDIFFKFLPLELQSKLSADALNDYKEYQEKLDALMKEVFIKSYSFKKLKAFIKKTWKGDPKEIVSFLKDFEEFYKGQKSASDL